MVHKAQARCPNGHIVEFGACNKEVRVLYLFRMKCPSTDHEVLSSREIRCRRCKTIHSLRSCPVCSANVPISAFQQKTYVDRLGEVYGS